MNKVDRALEIRVIDWLQWSEELPTRKEDGPNIVSLALELLEKRRLRNKELSMVIRKLYRRAKQDKICSNCACVAEIYKKSEHLLEPSEILRNA